ncbi:PEP-CTERM domain protein [Methylophilus sp. 5]|uniref:PEP-CTERM domain protein n=1 Tax=Methylophilus sp. 5 TaxID=1112274 RepID=UPI00048F8DC2|nr:PEP-CTERM domain protein [Methylophilus sp. 5]
MKLSTLIIAALAVISTAPVANAASSLNLANYAVSATYSLDVLNGTSGGISGLEASAVTYAQDRGSLFFVGDEGTGVIEMSLTGQTLGYMNFDWTNTGSTKHDTEGLTYLGNGTLVVGEERLYDAYRFNYSAGGTANLANNSVSISNANVGNSGMEGISYDARNGGSFVTIKQEAPEDILGGTLTFGTNGSGVATMSQLFDPSTLGLSTLSDVQTLSSVTSLSGTSGMDNLLLLSLGSKMLVEVNRQGQLISSFDLSSVVPHNAIEGVTIDENGTIYLVAEQEQDGSVSLEDARSKLIVLSSTITAVPEANSLGMLLAGLGLMSFMTRRRIKE